MNHAESKYFHTAECMDQAFLSLLEKTGFEYITVKAICQKAGVHRSTFYLHYETIDDLLHEAMEYMNRDFLSYMNEDPKALIQGLPAQPLERLNFITPKYLSPI